jgi:hypothetical protein
MSTIPDRLYIDSGDRELYQKLASECAVFDGKNNKEQFLFAMAVGFHYGTRASVDKREGFFLRKDLKPEDEALLASLAVFVSESADILSDDGTAFKVAEEYAHGGIAVLLDKIRGTQFGTFSKQFEGEISELCERASGMAREQAS